MRVAYCTGIRNLPWKREPMPELYDDFLELGEMAEELGFYRVWLSEHHFAEDDWGPSPLLALSALSQRTKRVRMGTFVTLVGMHNPLRLAEDCAMLDILSHGRFDFGFGAGGMAVEYETFGINPKESFGRTYEALEIMTRCWTEEEFSHEGRYYNFKNVRMRPKPVQQPIPLYSAALGPQSIERSARLGYGQVSAVHAHDWQRYQKIAAEAGKTVDVVSGPMFIHLAETKEKAWDECETGMHWSLDFYRRRGVPTGDLPPVGEFRHTGRAFGAPIPVGTPDDVMNLLRIYKDEPLHEIALGFGFPGMPHDAAKRAMRLFAKECMPEINSWGTTVKLV